MNIDEFLNRDPLFAQETPEDQDKLRNYYRSNPDAFVSMYQSHPVVQDMTPDERQIADSFYVATPKPGAFEKAAQTIKSTGYAAEAGLARSMGGTIRAAGEWFDEPELAQIGAEMSAQNAQEQADALAGIPKENTYQRFMVDVGSSLLQNIPGFAASAVTGAALPGLLYAAGSAAASRYDEARNAGYNETEAAGMGAIAGAFEAGFEKLPLDNFLKGGRSAAKKVLMGALTEGAEEIGTEAANMLTDKLIDDVYRDQQALLSDPNVRTAGDALKKVFYSGLVGMGAGTGMGAAGYARDVLYDQHLDGKNLARVRAGENDSVELAVPKAFAAEMQTVLDSRREEVKTPEDAQRIVDEYVANIGRTPDQHVHETTIKSEISETPLDTVYASAAEPITEPAETTGEMATEEIPTLEATPTPTLTQPTPTQPTPTPTQQAPQFQVGQIVGVPLTPGSPVMQVTGNLRANIPVDVQITKINGDGSMEGKTIEGGKPIHIKSKQGLFPPLSTEGFVREPGGLESPQLIRFLRDTLTTGKNIEDMTHEERARSVGNAVAVWDKIKGNIFGEYSADTTRIRMIWDLMTYHPEFADRILSHEIGHFIHLTDRKTLNDMGLGDFIPFKDFLDLLTPNLPPAQFQTYQRLLDQWNALPAPMQQEMLSIAKQWAIGGQHATAVEPWEVMADVLSAMLSRPKGVTIGPIMQKAWDNWLKMSPKAQHVLDRIYATAKMENPAEMMKRAATAKAYAEKIAHGGTLSGFEEFRRNYLSTWANAFARLEGQSVPSAQVDQIRNRVEEASFGGMQDQIYLESAMMDFFKRKLAAAGVTEDQITNYAFYNRILKDRTATVQIATLKPGQKVSTATELYNLLHEEATKIVEADPALQGLTDTEKAAEIEGLTKDLLDDQSFIREIAMMNPGGWTKKQAQAEMDKMLAELGVDKFEALKDIFRGWQDLRQNYMVETLAKSGLVGQGWITHMRNNPDYVTFQVVHHAFKRNMQRQGNGSMAKAFQTQRGTYADIGHVLYETVAKDIHLVTMARWQTMRRDTLLNIINATQHVPDNQKLVREVRKVGGQWPKKLEQNERLILLNDGGVQRGFVVDEVIDDLLKPVDKGNRIWGTDYITRWMTALNLGFGIINPIRDIFRTIRNMPGWEAIWKVPLNFAGNLPGIARAVFTDTQADHAGIRELAEKHLAIPSKEYADWGLTTKDRLLVQLGKTPEGQAQVQTALDSLWFQARRVANAFEWGMGAAVRSTELASRLAAWQYAKTLPGRTEAQLKVLVRNCSGTPNLLERPRPSTIFSILLFYNPFVQGMRGDFRAFKENKFEWMAKTFALQAPARLFALAALSGLLDKWLEEMFGKRPEDEMSWKDYFMRIPMYQLFNYPIIPVGLLSDNKAAYLTVPLDPVGQTMGAWAMAASLGAFVPEFPMGKAMTQAFETGAGMFPQLHPLVDALFVSTPQLLNRGNIYDPFRGRDVIDRATMTGGTFIEKAAPVLKYYLFNKGLGGPLNTIMRIPYTTENTDNLSGDKKIMDHIVAVTGCPVLGQPTVGRLLRSSDRGMADWERIRTEAYQEELGRVQMTARRVAAEALATDRKIGQVLSEQWANGKITDETKQLIGKHDESFKRHLSSLVMRSEVPMDQRLAEPWRALLNAKNPEAKARAAQRVVDVLNTIAQEAKQ